MSDSRPAVVPRVRLRVGVTGHRPGPKLPPEAVLPVRTNVERILGAIASSVRDTVAAHGGGLVDRHFELVIISALAEGSDRIVAEVGLAAGYGLEAVLPFARGEYEKDFETAESRTAFASLLSRAAAVLELDGNRDHAGRAYEAAGLVTLANCDLLLAIWDEREAAGIGGTATIVDRAVNERIPVVLINPAQPAQATLLWAGEGTVVPASVRYEELPKREVLAALPAVIDFLVAPPTGKPREYLATFLAETERRWNFGPWYALLAFVFAGRRFRRGDFQLPSYLPNARAQWADYFSAVRRKDRLGAAIEEVLLPAFAAADNLSVYYARVYRSTYIINYLAAATVATMAVLGLILHEREWHALVRGLETLELVVIGAVILTWWRGHRQQWHRRWIEYRRLAESLRHMRLIALTASVGPIARPGRAPVGEVDWVDWYVRSIRRQLPLPHQTIDLAFMESVRRATSDVELRDQIAYHEANYALMETLDHRLHALGHIFFVSTALTLISLLFLPERMHQAKTILIFFTVAFPAFGAAFNAIRAQSDFSTVARRSRQTRDRLAALRQVLAGERPTFARLADRVEMTSSMMMDDLVEWQIVFRTRPLWLPA
ncbi:MAG TPA: hypothetical protein VNL39_03050 [Xanthobacteraceae bacterium]|nr:hypothetical protein [Xanthobacteraceae bacterium]